MTRRSSIPSSSNSKCNVRTSSSLRNLSVSRAQPSSTFNPSSLSPIVRNSPINPVVARSKYQSLLTSYELTEILSYPDIYYVGLPSAKIPPNSGFDTDGHRYKVNIRDHIAYRYEIRSSFGRGAFGDVLKCFDHKTKEIVALKVIVNTPEMTIQGRAEMTYLTSLNRQDLTGSSNIVKLLHTFEFRSHICGVFECLGENLYEFLKRNDFQPHPISTVRPIAKQLLQAISFTHSQGIVHCDVKPENVVFRRGNFDSVRLIDFGSACQAGVCPFSYIQSRYYRAPEVILGFPYGPPMDIWSFACVIVELMNGRPLFAGDSEASQLRLQAELIGPLPPNLAATAPRRAVFFNLDGRPRTGPPRPKNERQTFRSVVHSDDVKLIDLLKKCLVWDQTARITAAVALQHPFFEEERQPLKSEQVGPGVSPRRVSKSPEPVVHPGGVRKVAILPKKGRGESPKRK